MCFCETNWIDFTRKTGVKSLWQKSIERHKWEIPIRFVFRENSIAVFVGEVWRCAASAGLRLQRKTTFTAKALASPRSSYDGLSN
jgi:hypothetical protein